MTTSLRVLPFLSLVVFAAFTADNASARPKYTVQGLGDLPGGQFLSIPAAINNFGQVVGVSSVDQGPRAFLWESGAMIDLGTLPGGDQHSWAFDINDRSQVVGVSPAGGYRAFLWDAGVLTPLGAGQFLYSNAQGINATGQVVGEFSIAGGGQNYSFVWTASNGFQTLANPGESALRYPVAINDIGWVVGHGVNNRGYYSPSYWFDDRITVLDNLSGSSAGFPNAVNNIGQIVGWSELTRGRQATLWTGGDVISLGNLGGARNFSEAFGVNDVGQIVGRSTGDVPTEFGRTNAFLWEDGTMTNLNYMIDPVSGWVLWDAYDINNSGQIVGLGRSPQGNEEAFLLTPVPEPSSLSLMVLLVGGLATCRIRLLA